MDRSPRPDNIFVEKSFSRVQTYMSQVYGWMGTGLLLTAFIAWYLSGSPQFIAALYSNTVLLIGLVVAQLALVFVISGMVHRLSGAVLTTLFMLYAALTGVTLSSIFIVYTTGSIVSTFFISAGMFAALSFYGFTTKRDMSGWGRFLFMALVGFVLTMIVNIWLKSSGLNMILPYIGVLLFAGLTAYDTQKLKNIGENISENSEDMRRYSIMGALTLYLDFINLFLMLLRILGDRR